MSQPIRRKRRDDMEVAREPAASGFVRAVVGAFGVTMVVLGLWAWVAPVANTLHAVNHGIDLTLGGHVGAQPAPAGFSVLAAVTLHLRVRQNRETERSRNNLHT